MKISDSVYEELNITEPVLIELIKSKPLQRLKHINQAGTQLVFPHIKTNRFEHCVGVMWLLKIKGAAIEEQIAGLLHDVPHTAFSHLIDFVFDRGRTADYHEMFLKEIVFKSEIPSILKKYGIDPDKVTDEHNFPLLERDLPALCADRIDYCLRDLLMDKVITKVQARKILNSIIVHNNRFVMNDKIQAANFATKYFAQSDRSWISPKTLATFKILADAIKYALKTKVLTNDDLFQTDNFVLSKLRKAKDQKIRNSLKILKPSLKVKEDQKNYDFNLYGKVRYIDPQILINGNTQPLSKLDKAFAKSLHAYQKKLENGRFIKIINS